MSWLRYLLNSATLILLSIGLSACAYGVSQDQEQVVWLGFLLCLFGFFVAVMTAADAIYQASQNPERSDEATLQHQRTDQ